MIKIKQYWGVFLAICILSLVCLCLYNVFDNSILANRAIPVRPERRHGGKPLAKQHSVVMRSLDQSTPHGTPSNTSIQQMVQTCKRINGVIPPPVSADVIPLRNKVDTHHAIIYCPITKVGSTFWNRLLKDLGRRGRTTSQSRKGGSGRDFTPFGEYRDTVDVNEMTLLINSSTSFLFVREPYGRLLSGYVDKLYHTNANFWNKIGRDIVRLVRKKPTKTSLMCGHDVTFPELVKALIMMKETPEQINGHFTPMHLWCNPCQYQYDFVGRMETFQQDLEFLLAKWHEKYGDLGLKIDQLSPRYTISTTKGRVEKNFQSRNCTAGSHYPVYSMLLRTWRNLQIRGIISKRIAMPMSTSKAGAIDQRTFENIVLTAIKQSVNRTELKQQREEALIQAYQSVPLEDMEQLRRYVLRDCQYFGYDDRPEKLFQRSGQKSADGFNYFDGLKETVDP